MSISAIVVVYRTRDLLHRLLDELFHEPRVSQILVLDNSGEEKGSTSSRDSRPLYLTNRKNIGFAAAVNQAAALANSKWVAVINPDVRLIGRCLGELFDAAQAHDAPAVGPRFYCDDAKTFRLPPATGFCRSDYWLGRLARQHAIDARLYQFHWNIRHERFWTAKKPFIEPFLSGALLLINSEKTCPSHEPLLDERFFLYFNDTDFCIRPFLSNQPPLCIPSAEAVHYWNQSLTHAPTKARHISRSQNEYWNKHYEEEPPAGTPSVIILPEMENLGFVESAPSFSLDRIPSGEDSYFKVSKSSYFVSFARALINYSNFKFPGNIWNFLAAGTYFCRVRASLSGDHRVWKWNKR